jgi:HPr-like protein crh
MVYREVKVSRSFTAQDASDLVELCHKYTCEIFLQKPAVKVNAKSLMGVISVGMKQSATITVVASGDREEEALDKVAAFIAG